MTEQELHDVVIKLFEKILDCPGKIAETDSLDSFKSWDSMRQLTLLSELSNTFKVKFRMHDIVSLKTIGDYKQCIKKKINMD